MGGPARRRLGIAALLAALGAPSSGAPPLAAQTVRGTIVSAEDAAPIEGAFVSLIDAAGTEIDGNLSGAEGQFRLDAPPGGPYRVRVARIGLQTWVSDVLRFEGAPSLSVRFEVPIEAIRLATIDVTVHDQCVLDPAHETEVWTVWDEARKALATTALAEREAVYRFELRLYQRELDAETGEVLRVLTRTRAPFAHEPFKSLPVSRLQEVGYAIMEGDSIRYYMPDAAALLSPEFETTHCFGLRRRQHEGAPQIGVTFRPLDPGGRTEIEGVLWLDDATAELRTLEYRYVNAPLGILDPRLGGAAEFVRLPAGTFVVSRWSITMPQVQRLVDYSGRRLRERIGSLKEDGGVVFAVFTARGEPVHMTRPPPEREPPPGG